jgi:hypothetical protein
MFHVLDHADVVYTGYFSDSTQYVIEHYGARLDEAIRSGIRILYSDALYSLTQSSMHADWDVLTEISEARSLEKLLSIPCPKLLSRKVFSQLAGVAPFSGGADYTARKNIHTLRRVFHK